MGFLDPSFLVVAVDTLNADPQAPEALAGWTFDVGLVADDPGGAVGVMVRAPAQGRVPPAELVPADALLSRPPPYFARASREDFRLLLLGTLDPIAAIVGGRLRASGDLTPLIERLSYRGLLDRWLEVMRPLT